MSERNSLELEQDEIESAVSVSGNIHFTPDCQLHYYALNTTGGHGLSREITIRSTTRAEPRYNIK